MTACILALPTTPNKQKRNEWGKGLLHCTPQTVREGGIESTRCERLTSPPRQYLAYSKERRHIQKTQLAVLLAI
jgi:hypothetical protein